MKDRVLRFYFTLFSIGCLFGSQPTYSQTFNTDSLIQRTRETIDNILYKTQDTNYIRDYSDELALYLLSQLKLNNFGVWDRNNNNSITYTPENRGFIGLGMSYKWLGLELAFNVDPLNRQDEDPIFFDFQASAFTRKDFIEATLQYYYQYRINDYSSDIPVANQEYNRNDIRTINLGLQFYHVFSYDKFSLRAPFLMTQLQKKSAGSVIGGANFYMFIMDADSTIIPPELNMEFHPQLQLQDLNAIGLSTNWGYIHTFSWWKKFFLTLSAMPGISLNAGDYFTNTRTLIDPHLAFSFKTMNAVGYNSRRFFTGFRFIGDLNFMRVEPKLHTLISRGRLKFYIGWRFKNRKKG